MGWVLELVLLLVLAFLIYEDLRYRAYHWVLLPPLLILFIIKASWFLPWSELLGNLAYNLAMVGVLFLGVKAYLRLKEGRDRQVVDRAIGSGDLFLMGVLGAAFSPFNFVLFLTFVLLVALLFGAVTRLFASRAKGGTVPLAAVLSLTMVALEISLVIKNAHSFAYDDRIWAMLLYG